MPAVTLSVKVGVTIRPGTQASKATAQAACAGVVGSAHSSVTSVGQTSTGATVSTTEMRCTHVLVLRQSSHAIHVRSMVLADGHGHWQGRIESR